MTKVDIEDIYAEFSYGIFDPRAIRKFLQYAYHNWQQPAPTYVLLVGDATNDYQNCHQLEKKNIVPVYLSKNSESILISDDNWLCLCPGR